MRPTHFNHERYACPGGCISDSKRSADAQILQNGVHSPWSVIRAKPGAKSPWGDPQKISSEARGVPEAGLAGLSKEALGVGGEGGSTRDKTVETSASPESPHKTPRRGEGRRQPDDVPPSSHVRTPRSPGESLEEERLVETPVVDPQGSYAKFAPAEYSAESEDYSGEPEELVSPTRESWGLGTSRDVPPKWMSSMYFNGQREQLRAWPQGGVELPRAQFSAELWVRPEGGQSNPAIIAGE